MERNRDEYSALGGLHKEIFGGIDRWRRANMEGVEVIGGDSTACKHNGKLSPSS